MLSRQGLRAIRHTHIGRERRLRHSRRLRQSRLNVLLLLVLLLLLLRLLLLLLLLLVVLLLLVLLLLLLLLRGLSRGRLWLRLRPLNMELAHLVRLPWGCVRRWRLLTRERLLRRRLLRQLKSRLWLMRKLEAGMRPLL